MAKETDNGGKVTMGKGVTMVSGRRRAIASMGRGKIISEGDNGEAGGSGVTTRTLEGGAVAGSRKRGRASLQARRSVFCFTQCKCHFCFAFFFLLPLERDPLRHMLGRAASSPTPPPSPRSTSHRTPFSFADPPRLLIHLPSFLDAPPPPPPPFPARSAGGGGGGTRQ